jgi:hypothetical protein
MPTVRQHQTTHTRIQANRNFSLEAQGVQELPPYMADSGADQPRQEDANRGDAVSEQRGTQDATNQARSGGAKVQYRASDKTAVVNWPFMYSYREGRCFVNTSPRRSAYAQAQDVGDALI